MRLTKKILSTAVAAILSLSLITVSAASTVEVSMDYMNSISVSGVIDGEGMRPVNIMVRLTDSSGELVYVGVSKTAADDDGNLSYRFDTELLSLSLPSDTYTISISGRNLKTPLTDNVNIHGADRKLKALKAISDAATEIAVETAVEGTTEGYDNFDILKFDIELYDSVETADGNFVNTYLKGKTYDLSVNTEDGLSDDEIAKIHSAIKVFHKDYTDAVAMVLFTAIDSTDDFESWYDTYYEHYEFHKNDKATAIVKEVMKEADFARRMKEQTKVLSVDEIKEFIYESALCTYVCEKTDSEVEKLIGDFSEYFVTGESYADIKDYELPAVIDAVAGNIYDTCKDVTDALDEAAKEVIDARGSEGDDDEDDHRGGVTVSGTGGGYKPKEEKPEEVITPPVSVIFSDLDGAPWAKEAIEALYSKGIISGKPDGSFMPNANITRAEFIKIVAEALSLEESAENVFADVPEGSWYAPYVSKAYAAGLVKGDDSNNFRPDADITRQDMVTILYRALNVNSEAASEVTFTDKDAIAGYAYPAVEYFAGKGIVNGFEDGSFAPTRNTTRAQASAVLYKLIVNLL